MMSRSTSRPSGSFAGAVASDQSMRRVSALPSAPVALLSFTGTVKLNKATGADGNALTRRMDWSLATAPANDPDGLLVDLDIISAIKLQIHGAAALDVAGAVVAHSGTVDNTLATM